MPAIRKKERDYEGMFEFRKEDVSVVIRHLIIGKFKTFRIAKSQRNENLSRDKAQCFTPHEYFNDITITIIIPFKN
jgi:hypothetical protein